MTKRIISLLLAVLMFAALPMAGAFADKETVEYTIGTETMKDICKNNGLDYDFCKDAIIKLNPTRFTKESDFSSLMVGWKIKLPKTNQDAADILGVALPDSLKPKAAGDTQIYTVVKNDTLIGICDKLKLDYGKCKAAIMKLNGWSDYNLLTLHVGDKVKLPKSDADAAVIAASATGTATGTTTATGGIFLPTDGAVAAYMVPHVVKTGETLYGICVENGIDFNKYINLIMKASGLKSATIYTGDIVFIPSASATSGATSVITHIVKGGETVYGICQTYGIDFNARYNMIVALNPNKNINNIHSGDVLYLPKGGTTTGGGTATGGTATGGSSGGPGGGYTPAAADPAVTQKNLTAKEGAMYYLKEYTVATDDTVYNLLTKKESLDSQYFNYYVNVMLAANARASFSNLKSGEKILIASASSAGAKVAVTGVKVKTGDTVIKMCTAAGISYDDNANLIAKLNPGVNFNNLKVGDIVVLPKKP